MTDEIVTACSSSFVNTTYNKGTTYNKAQKLCNKI